MVLQVPHTRTPSPGADCPLCKGAGCDNHLNDCERCGGRGSFGAEPTVRFNTTEWSDIANALRVAAERYGYDARMMRDHSAAVVPGARARFDELAGQFDKQAVEATEYADRICEAEGV